MNYRPKLAALPGVCVVMARLLSLVSAGKLCITECFPVLMTLTIFMSRISEE